MTAVVSIPIEEVRVGPRHRRLVPGKVAALAQSIADLGLQHPISVYRTTFVEGGRDVPGFQLVAGMHRLEACRSLGLVEIPAIEVELTDVQREMWELAENVVRAELTELERAEHLNLMQVLYESLHPETRKGAFRGNQYTGNVVTDKLSFATDVAQQTGVDERTIRRSTRRAREIDDAVKEQIRDTPIADSGVDLDALAGMKAAEQKKVVGLVMSGKAKNVREARKYLNTGIQKTAPADGDEKQLKAIQSAWNRASQAAREAFLAWLEDSEPAVFDRTRSGRAA